MSMKRLVLIFTGIGAAFPLGFLAVYQLSPAFRHWWHKGPVWMESAMLAVWPSSLLLMADPEGQSVWPPIISVALNVVLYAILGWLFWIGIKRSPIVLVGTAAAILVGWYGLLSL
jgi:hypothetical protein